MPERSAESLRLIPCKNGGYSLRVVTGPGGGKILHSLYDPHKEARRLVDRFSFDGRGLVVVLGLGLGYHVLEMVHRWPGAEICVVEALREVQDLALRNPALAEIREKIHLFAGLPQAEALREITRRQLAAGMKPIRLFVLASAASAFPEYYEPLRTSLEKAAAVNLSERLRYPKFKGEAARVLLVDFGYFLTREIRRACRALGHPVTVIPVEGQEGSDALIGRLIERILAFKPDFLLTVNHLGFDEEGLLTAFFRSIEMPVASWYVDNPNLIVKAFAGNVSPFTALFVWDETYIDEMKRMGFESVTYLPLATDASLFRPAPPGNPRLRAYRCEVGFVGDSMVRRVEKWHARLRPSLRPLAEELARRMYASRRPLEELFQGLPPSRRELLDQAPAPERAAFEAAVLLHATLFYRRDCVAAVTPFRYRVHGDEGWHGLFQESVRIFPALDYYRELPLFYNACAVNLNATSLQMAAAVNQRVFDVPACGGFLLTDRRPSLAELFEVGREVVTFEEPEEIPEVVRFYLDRPGSRREIATRGRARVLREHTYRHRLEVLIRTMRSRYG